MGLILTLLAISSDYITIAKLGSSNFREREVAEISLAKRVNNDYALVGRIILVQQTSKDAEIVSRTQRILNKVKYKVWWYDKTPWISPRTNLSIETDGKAKVLCYNKLNRIGDENDRYRQATRLYCQYLISKGKSDKEVRKVIEELTIREVEFCWSLKIEHVDAAARKWKRDMIIGVVSSVCNHLYQTRLGEIDEKSINRTKEVRRHLAMPFMSAISTIDRISVKYIPLYSVW